MTFWGGSGSGDPCLWLMNPDQDPGSGSCYFRHWPLRCQQKTNFLHNFFCLLLFEATFTSFFKDKKSKESQNSRNQGFSYHFCMMKEGSGSGSTSGSGSRSIPRTSGSGSGRPKNMWIRWIRIRNTASNPNNCFTSESWALSSLGRPDPGSNTNVVGSVSDPDWIRIQSGQSVPDPGGKKWRTKIGKNFRFHVLKFWMFSFSFEGWRLLLELGRPFWSPRDR
jgi:hypothetical protein